MYSVCRANGIWDDQSRNKSVAKRIESLTGNFSRGDSEKFMSLTLRILVCCQIVALINYCNLWWKNLFHCLKLANYEFPLVPKYFYIGQILLPFRHNWGRNPIIKIWCSLIWVFWALNFCFVCVCVKIRPQLWKLHVNQLESKDTQKHKPINSIHTNKCTILQRGTTFSNKSKTIACSVTISTFQRGEYNVHICPSWS